MAPIVLVFVIIIAAGIAAGIVLAVGILANFHLILFVAEWYDMHPDAAREMHGQPPA